MTGPGKEFLDGLESIAGLAIAHETIEAMLEVVASLAKQLVPGTDGAGLTLSEGGRWRTRASTDHFVDDVDAAQYESGSGPCLEAALEVSVVRSNDLSIDGRWEEFSTLAVQAGVRSVVSAPVSSGEASLGALNLYSFQAGAFMPDADNVVAVLARHAAIALVNRAQLGDGERLAEQLREALLSRELIGEAKGILMAIRGVSSEEAFELLRDLSQSQNRKLRTVAEELIADASRGGLDD